jgi:hypothetical protein
MSDPTDNKTSESLLSGIQKRVYPSPLRIGSLFYVYFQQMLTINESGEWGVRNFAGTLRPLCSANKVPGLVY